MSDAAAAMEAPALIKAIREDRDGAAMSRAYLLVFGNPLGRLVLAHHLNDCNVGAPIGPDDNRYAAGRHDAALDLASKAGFDAAALAVSVLTGDLEGQDHEHAFGEILDTEDEVLG